MPTRSELDRRSRRRCITDAVEIGVISPIVRHLRAELADPEGPDWVTSMTVGAMRRSDLATAGELARTAAALQLGTPAIAAEFCDGAAPLPPTGVAHVRPARAHHDLAQLRHLSAIGPVGQEVESTIDELERIVDVVDSTGSAMTIDPAERLDPTVGFGRIVHWPQPARRARSLSPHWDRTDVQMRYRTNRPGIVVIDDFLMPDVLADLYSFCVTSTIWTGDRYAYGRLGSFMLSGFDCPLLMQIAEELRAELPEVLGRRYGLRQLWGFKNTGHLPAGTTVHADFAAVNVNMWLTPTDANLDEGSGGMVVYDVAAPRDWDFPTYNEHLPAIQEHLQRQGARAIRIPYRQNRAIIFDSDLFHATETVRFRDEHRHRRMNLTMLFGDRAADIHHPPAPPAATSQGWRTLGASRRGRR